MLLGHFFKILFGEGGLCYIIILGYTDNNDVPSFSMCSQAHIKENSNQINLQIEICGQFFKLRFVDDFFSM